MIKNILFDLDGTLINIDQEGFNKEYMDGVAQFFAKYGYDKNNTIKLLWGAIMVIVNNDGKCTNEEVFCNYLEKNLNMNRETILKIFDEFTNSEYDLLKKYVKKVDLVTKAINLLKEKQYNLILATNAVFPYDIVKKRASWGNIDINDFSFVTNIDNMNYAKPNINYYKQILELNNLKAEECIMFGNDLIEDLAIEKLGIDCFIITDNMINGEYLINSKLNGNYEDFYKYIEDNL